MGAIQVLRSDLVNRIAAGECVERPASVVKELIENALDAGASQVDVTIEEGGRQLVKVSDDGVGMDADDLRMCVQPHATSKISNDDDLFNVRSMGFRGEALPSIASVSRTQITSRTRDSDAGYTIRAEAGSVGEVVPCGAPQGTIVEVRDLFFCVPARRKFLKTNQTETGHVTEQFARLALAHPGVGFVLKHRGRVTHALRATADARQRLGDFYGPELADVLLPIRRAAGGVLVEGWVAPPNESRASGKWEYVFVNGRYVRDRFVSHAIKEAYRGLLDPSRFPVAFIFITIDPSQVDVNVHPTKCEVRWRDSNYVHGQVLAALREKFLSTNLDQTLRTRAGEHDVFRERVKKAMVDFFTSNRSAGSRPAVVERNHPNTGQSAAPAADGARSEKEGQPPGRTPGVSAVGVPHARTPAEQEEYPPAEDSDAQQDKAETFSAPAGPLAHDFRESSLPGFVQIHNTYIVAETDDGLMIIDQHALHERVLYEELCARIGDRPLESQRLLLPETVRVPADRIEVLETHAELLGRLGIELTRCGPQSVSLHAFPSLLERVDRRRFVNDLLEVLGEGRARPSPETLIHQVLDMMACKAAVKAGDPLTNDEIKSLLGRRSTSQRSSHCPHGRPTTLHLTLRDLQHQFKRR